MGTRSTITVKFTKDGKYRGIYCHWDGYPAHVGKMLLEHYNSQVGAELVVSEGDLSSLNESMEKPKGHCFATPVEGYSIAYKRDRGEKGTRARVGKEYPLKQLLDCWQKYEYLWDGERWLVCTPSNRDEKIPLTDHPLIQGVQTP
ncbi:MAG: hypothetical protein WC824_12700 [Bacteroidota bacterium]|jgi:hypothetical protein